VRWIVATNALSEASGAAMRRREFISVIAGTAVWPLGARVAPTSVTAMSEEVCAFLLLWRGFLGEGSDGITSQNYLGWKYNQSASTGTL
jgi:hypothetical protein